MTFVPLDPGWLPDLGAWLATVGAAAGLRWFGRLIHNVVITRMALRDARPAERAEILLALAELREFSPAGGFLHRRSPRPVRESQADERHDRDA